MPLSFHRSLIGTGATTTSLETIVVIQGYSVGSAYSDLPSKSFSITKDELGICGTPTNDGASSTQMNYLPLTNGTYNFEVTGVSGGTTRINSFKVGIGKIANAGGSPIVTFTNNKQYNGDGTASSTLTLPSFPDSLGSVTINSGTDAKGLLSFGDVTNGGFAGSMPSATVRITAT